jgi:hypothetical protein
MQAMAYYRRVVRTWKAVMFSVYADELIVFLIWVSL